MNTELIDRFDMLPRSCRVLVAVSGGADSVYLLHNLLALSVGRGFSVCAAHYNHGLRGAESDRDERFTGGLCSELGVDYMVGRGDVAAYAEKNGLGTEEAARELRYAFLREAAEELGADRIATAHTADDNAETLLLNLARGAGLRGLGAIPPVRGDIIRPLLTTTREEIDAYLEENSVAHVEDSTNALDDYARNRVRHFAVPALESVNAGFVRSASRAALLLREDEEYLDSLAREFIRARLEDDALPSGELSALPPPVASRVVRLLCGAGLSEKHVASVLAIARGTERAFADVPGMRVEARAGALRFGAEETVSFADTPLPAEGTVRPEGADFEVSVSRCENDDISRGTVHSFFFNCGNICGNILCTPRRDGDRIRLAGRGCTKSVAKLFAEKRLTGRERAMTPVLRDEVGVLAVYGFGQAERAAGGTLRVDIIKK